MSDKEKVRALAACLKGSRKKAYDVEVRTARTSGLLSSDPVEVYRRLKERMMEFKEGLLEKQQRLSAEWKTLSRGKLSAIQFQPIFENAIAELELAGIGKSE